MLIRIRVVEELVTNEDGLYAVLKVAVQVVSHISMGLESRCARVGVAAIYWPVWLRTWKELMFTKSWLAPELQIRTFT